MKDKPSEQGTYQKWLTKHRDVSPPTSLTDQVMAGVADIERDVDYQRRGIWCLSLIHRIENSRAARWAMCSVALLIGSVPFLFLAYVAEFLTF